MFLQKKCLLLFCFIFLVLRVSAQTSIRISEYGAYFIDNGVLKKIPTTAHICEAKFWRNYIIFSAETSVFRLFYNMENGAVSDLLWPGEGEAGFFPRESGNKNLIFYYYGIDYELDPVTLRTVSKQVLERTEKVFEMPDFLKFVDQNGEYIPWGELQWVHGRKEESINEYVTIYDGKNYYLEVMLSPDLINSYRRYAHGGVRNQFVYIIYEGPHIER